MASAGSSTYSLQISRALSDLTGEICDDWYSPILEGVKIWLLRRAW